MKMMAQPSRQHRRRNVRSGALIGALWLALAVPAAADPVAFDAQQGEGYGRVVFAWPSPVAHTSDLQNAVLTLTFARPVESDPSVLAARFPAYVREVRLSADGRTLTVEITKHFLHCSFADGPRVIVDLLGSGIAPAQPGPVAAAPAPAAPAPPAAAPPGAAPAMAAAEPASGRPAPGPVAVRIGQHDGYGRVVFDWTREVGYSAERAGNVIVIRFERPDGADLAAFEAGRLDQVRIASARVDGAATVVELAVADGARLRHFRSETKIVIDVLDPPGAAAAAAGGAAQSAATTPAEAEAPTVAEVAAALPSAPTLGPAATASGPPPAGEIRVTLLSLEPGRVRIEFALPGRPALAAFERAGYLWIVFDAPTTGDVPAVPGELTGSLFLAERVPVERASAFRFRINEGLHAAVFETDAG